MGGAVRLSRPQWKPTEERHADANMANIQSLDLPTIAVRSSIMIDFPELEGTVAASMDNGYAACGDSSQSLIQSAPVRARPPAVRQKPDRLRAKDLAAELDSINSQIHKIMFQVERAVARLATSG